MLIDKEVKFIWLNDLPMVTKARWQKLRLLHIAHSMRVERLRACLRWWSSMTPNRVSRLEGTCCLETWTAPLWRTRCHISTAS